MITKQLKRLGELSKLLVGSGSQHSGPAKQRGDRLELPDRLQRFDGLREVAGFGKLLRRQISAVIGDPVRKVTGSLRGPLRPQAKAQDNWDQER